MDIFKVLGCKRRREILRYIKKGINCACKLEKVMTLHQSVISRHLGVLLNSGLIEIAKIEGKKVFYKLKHPHIVNVIDELERF